MIRNDVLVTFGKVLAVGHYLFAGSALLAVARGRGALVVVGLGVDLLENDRVAMELTRGEWLLDDGIFTPEEIRYCNNGRNSGRRYALCFAAKEATLKAINADVRDLGIFREVEVHPGVDGQYRLILRGSVKTQFERLGGKHIRLSVAGTARSTAAMVLMEN